VGKAAQKKKGETDFGGKRIGGSKNSNMFLEPGKRKEGKADEMSQEGGTRLILDQTKVRGNGVKKVTKKPMEFAKWGKKKNK